MKNITKAFLIHSFIALIAYLFSTSIIIYNSYIWSFLACVIMPIAIAIHRLMKHPSFNHKYYHFLKQTPDLPFLHIEASKYHDLFSRKITFEND